MPAGLDPVAGGLDHREAHPGFADEPRKQADRVRATTDAGHGKVRQPALDRVELRRSLVADPSLQVADERRIRVRPHRRSEHVVRRLDVGHPVAHGLVDGVLERRRAGGHRSDLGTERPHPEHVRALALDVLLAHVDDARQVQQGTGGGRRDAVLAGTGLGDDPGLPETAGQERLPKGVVDLVGAGVGEVLPLQVEAERRDRLPAPVGQPRRLVADGRGEPVRSVDRRRAAGEPLEQLAQLRPEDRIVADRVVGGFELLEGGHQRFGDVPTAEVPLHPPSTRTVGIEQAGMHRVSARTAGSGGHRAPHGLA